MMNFSVILKELREKHGYSQKQLADILHVSKNSVSHYELGQCMPSIDVIISIADVFDVSMDYLLGRSTVHCQRQQVSLKLAERIYNTIICNTVFDYTTKKYVSQDILLL